MITVIILFNFNIFLGPVMLSKRHLKIYLKFNVSNRYIIFDCILSNDACVIWKLCYIKCKPL